MVQMSSALFSRYFLMCGVSGVKARTLKLAQEDVARLSSELLSLRASSDEVKNEHRRLQEELARRDTEEAQQEKGGLGIGEGMSELNPELSEELARLRHDNKELNAQVFRLYVHFFTCAYVWSSFYYYICENFVSVVFSLTRASNHAFQDELRYFLCPNGCPSPSSLFCQHYSF